VEIRNQLTLELITILQPPETIPDLTGPLVYSPDGRSIACASDIAIIIWDIQTGGVAKEIKCSAHNISLVWSSNGGTICTIDSQDQAAFTVHTYDFSSGTISSLGTLRSEYNPHLWTVDESFRVMTMMVGNRHNTKIVNIFEVGSTLTKIQSFSPCLFNIEHSISFSPTTHRISVSEYNVYHGLFICDVRSSAYLLHTDGNFVSRCFSSDGSLFAASEGNIVRVWKYDSGHYVLYGKFRFQGLYNPPIQLSPTLSSILGHSKNILQVLRLHELPTAPEIRPHQYVGLSRSGTRVATAHKMESTVTITNLLAQTPPQFIDTDVAVEGLALTGNVLLVVGSKQLVAWLLTEEGLVDGVIGNRRVGRGDSIWSMLFRSKCVFRAEGQVGVIKLDGNALHVYHTDTGEVIYPTQNPGDTYEFWDDPADFHLGGSYLHFHNIFQRGVPLENRWQTSRATLREGWVKDAEGRHRLWIPVEWRTSWHHGDWYHGITTYLSYLGGTHILVKF